ncbi:peroxiredoxin family protein [Parasphingorhabdus sp.]|uniref:peroxiredoxin family protein n=1 Tax=Parasphingorhabdus sp. TaxID=2709688 RepID=UPI003A952C08
MNPTAAILSSLLAMTLSACSSAAPEGDSENEVASKPKALVAPITEAQTINAGLAVGEQVPMEARLLDDQGETTFADILEKGAAVVVFTRSVEWCPYCQTQLKSINALVPELKERGYNLYGLSYDSPEQQQRFAKNQMLRYEMLSDQPSAVIDAFGLRDPQYSEGRAVGVPYASVFVIDKSGMIVAKWVSGDYKKRPTNEQILALVDSI